MFKIRKIISFEGELGVAGSCEEAWVSDAAIAASDDDIEIWSCISVFDKASIEALVSNYKTRLDNAEGTPLLAADAREIALPIVNALLQEMIVKGILT